jgi:FMN phosphatase YigB (HAD superfamily)
VPITIGFGAEILGTGILLLVILSLLETRHANAPASWFFPLIVGSTVGLLIMFLAPLSQACFNPARDLGPRLMLVVMGFGETAIPGPRDGLALAVTLIGPVIGALLGTFFHDKVMRPLIPGVAAEPAITSPGQLAREPVQHLETSTSLLGHAPALPARLAQGNGTRTDGIDLVMLDVGGTIYDDDCIAQALLRATRELAGPRFDEQAFWHLYDEGRQAQTALRVPVAEHFGLDSEELWAREATHVEYPPSALYADVKPTLDLLATRYKLGVASQSDATTEAMRRDGLLDYFAVVATPRAAGANKTEARFWKWALDEAGVPAGRAVNVGNRLDSDIRPAQNVGMRSIWLLRGEAPPSPTVEQLSEPDAVVTSFSGVPNALAGLADVRVAGVAR